MHIASNPRRIIPPKERKKKSTDKAQEPYINKSSNQPKLNKELLLSHRPCKQWSREEIHKLIDHHHEILNYNRKTRKELHANCGYIIRQLRKQKFKCAVTGIPFSGGIAFGNRGVGIDIISTKRGITNGNMRLVSAPLAFLRSFGNREPSILLPTQELFQDDISYAISRYSYYQIKKTIVRHVPVEIAFNRQVTDPVSLYARATKGKIISCKFLSPFNPGSGLILSSRQEYTQQFWGPKDYQKLRNIKHDRYEYYYSPNQMTVFTVELSDDVLLITKCIPTQDHSRDAEKYRKATGNIPIKSAWDTVKIPLSDPNIDIITEITVRLNTSIMNYLRIAARREW